MRISFAGGGTDVPPFPEQEGGCTLSATIRRFAFGSLRPRSDDIVGVRSDDLKLSLQWDAIETARRPNYDGSLDLVKAAIHRLAPDQSSGFDLYIHSDAPPGSGLGSSSAMTVVLVGLLKELQGLALTDYEIAHLAFLAEREDLGVLGGFQDQYAAAFGGINFIEYSGDGVVVTPLRISADNLNEMEHNLILCFTGQTRPSDHIIQDQTKRFQEGLSATVDALRDQKELAVQMKNLLLRGKLNDFGACLHDAWQSKKRLTPFITGPRIDELYEVARKNGALGGKITGAGGGGYMLFYCPFELKVKVVSSLKQAGTEVLEVAFEPDGLLTWRADHA